ncbi:hypothetical protein ABIF97_001912 [Bradyrhizobium japonicum]
MGEAGQPIQKSQQDCGKRLTRLDFWGTRGCGEVAQSGSGACLAALASLPGKLLLASPYWKVISRHLEMSEPRPEEMMMQPRTFCAVTSAAQTE